MKKKNGHYKNNNNNDKNKNECKLENQQIFLCVD